MNNTRKINRETNMKMHRHIQNENTNTEHTNGQYTKHDNNKGN